MRIANTFALAALLALPLAATARERPNQPQQERQVGTTGAAEAATVNDLVDRPETYYGKTVMVSGKVSNAFSQKLFNLEENGVVDAKDELLVFWDNSPRIFSQDAIVQVTGVVKKFNKDQFAKDYGISDWGRDTDWVDSREGKPVVVASSVDVRK